MMDNHRNIFKLLLICTVIINCFPYNFTFVNGQRSLLHWKRDLELRLDSYLQRKAALDHILASSIYQAEQSINENRARINSGSNIRFTDLIVQNGSIILDRQVARPTARLLFDKALTYVSSKVNEVNHLRNQLSVISRQLANPPQEYIYKGTPFSLNITTQNNYQIIRGTRIFRQLNYARRLASNQLDLKLINYTDVDYVLRETYMENPNLGQLDPRSRIFFEGRKTFFNTVFTKSLRSGCCDRLKPLHTSRMMTRSTPQNVLPPVLLNLKKQTPFEQIFILNIKTNQLVNSILNLGSNVPSPIDNVMQLNNMIDLRFPNQQNIMKTLVLKGVVNIQNATLTAPDNRFVIGFISDPQVYVDLSHQNHLLRYFMSSNRTVPSPIQKVFGPVYINSAITQFTNGLNAFSINNVQDFRGFALTKIVRVDKPTLIRGTVQFNSLPWTYNNLGLKTASLRPPGVITMRVAQELWANYINGMSVPNDIIVLPSNQVELIRVYGPREFANKVLFKNTVGVRQLVNDLKIPEGVVPLHTNDLIGPVGVTRLLFKDGISSSRVNINNGQFDEIPVRDLYIDAPNLMFQSVFLKQPDGITHIIRAPLRIANLKLLANRPNQGLLNGFRPQDVIELSRRPIDTFYGRKTFLAPVEATECFFNEINSMSNWTNYLIRIDRPNTVQTVYTKLEFSRAPANDLGSFVGINSLIVEFLPNSSPANYIGNIRFSPELYVLYQALLRGLGNNTRGRIRITNQIQVINPRGGPGLVNGVSLDDIITLNEPFRFADRFTLVGKVQVVGNLRAGRITSNYPIDAMDLEQFNKYRIPIINSRAPIKLNNLVLASGNQASMIQCRMLNGIPFSQFANSIMSLTRPQIIDRSMAFVSGVNFEGLLRTGASLNEIRNFRGFTNTIKNARYSFENGLQCNTVIIKN